MRSNLDTVKAYFEHCVDGKQIDRMDEYFSRDVVVHRPDVDQPIVGLEKFKEAVRVNVIDRYERIQTVFNVEVVAGDVVVVHLKHEASGANTWHGFDVYGKNVTWTALTYFLFDENGMIIEEIVERNELSMAKQLGIISMHS